MREYTLTNRRIGQTMVVRRTDDLQGAIAYRVELAEPRELSVQERLLISYLLRHPLATPGLTAQAEVVRVAATCSCGCPSVWLSVDLTAASASFKADETPGGGTDHVALTAFQKKSRGTTETTLHVVDGRLFELAIWAGEGVRPRLDLSKLEYA